MPDETEMFKASIVALCGSKQRIHLALANSPIAVFEQDLDLRFTWIFNPKLGFRASEVVGKTDFDIMDPACALVLAEIKRRVIETGQPSRQEVAVAAAGAPPGYFDLSVEPRRDESGRIIGVISAATDITERRYAEKVRRLSEERFRLLVELAVDGIFLSDAAGNYVDVNTAGHEMLGYTRDEILSRTFADLLAPEELNRLPLPAPKLVEGDVTRSIWRFLRKDGSEIVGEVCGRQLPDGHVLGILSDITERERGEEALRASEAYSRSLFQSSPDNIKVISLDGRLEQMNDNGCRRLGIDDFEVYRGRYWPDFWPPKARAGIEAALAEARAGRTGRFSGFCPTEKGVPKWWDVTITAVPGADGSPVSLIASSRDVTEHKRAEETMRNNETLTRLAADAARMTYAEFDFKNGRLNLAKNFARVMGYTLPALSETTDLVKVNEDMLSHIAPEDRALVQAANQEFVGGKLDGSATYRVIGDDGAQRWIEGRWTAEADENGLPVRAVAASLDITERKRAEESLRENQQRIQLATEATGVGIWEWNLVTNAVWWDSQMFAIYGIPPTKDGFVSYQTWAAAVLPEDLAEQEELARKQVREGGINRRAFRVRRQDDGEIRVIEAVDTVRINGTGETQGIVGTNLDVTEKKRDEKALQESDDRLRLALSGAKAAAWQWNIVTNELIWSPESYELYGRDPERDLARYEFWRDCLHPDDLERTERLIVGMLDRGEKDYRTEYRIVLPTGDLRWLMAMGKVEFAVDGTPLRMSGVNLDITGQKRAEHELVESANALAAAKAEAERANQAKSKFLAAASHDLRQPVQSLVLLLSVIERQVASQPKTVEIAKMMRAAVDGLHGLLTSVLDISRLDAGVVAPIAECVDLGELVNRLAAEYAPKAASKELELRRVPRGLHALTDPALLERALRNLIENALRYTPVGGILLGVRRRGQFVRLDVIDTGIGIPADRKAVIFEEFHQLHNPGRNLEQGLGLGLAIVSRLASLLGAQVEVSSRLGRGSRFSLSLPIVHDAAPNVVDRAAIDDPGGRILIIEDNAIVRNGLEAMLRQCGYETLAAAFGEDALHLAAKESWRFDMILADYRLGAGLTGIETAKEIHHRAGRPTPTLVLTGDTAKERIAEIDASGFAILHKPVDADNLRREVARLLGA